MILEESSLVLNLLVIVIVRRGFMDNTACTQGFITPNLLILQVGFDICFCEVCDEKDKTIYFPKLYHFPSVLRNFTI